MHDRRESRPEARTETIPALPDDIFATFTQAAPDGIITGPIPTQAADHDPLAHLREEQTTPERGRLQSPDPRTLLIGAAGLLVLVIIALLAMVTSSGSGTTANRIPTSTSAADNAAAAAVAATFGGEPPTGLSRVASSKAAQLLAKAGQNSTGQLVEALTWKDNNGSNLVVSTRQVLAGKHMALKVIHLARVETEKPTKLRLMEEPSLPDCKQGGTAGFTKNSLVIRDLNGDGVAEVSAGWSSRCGEARSSEVKLALISDGEKFIIRGDGVIGSKAGSLQPDPTPETWPDGYLPALQSLFHKLYY